MSNPNIPLGVLNKIIGSVAVISAPQLNASSSFLGVEGIRMAFEGEASGYYPALVGGVPSPNPYQFVTVTIPLLKTQGLSAAWKAQIETNTTIGNIVITPDAITLPPYFISNASIMNVGELNFGGTSPEFVVTLRGTYQINGDLFV